MASQIGWVKIHRKILDKGWYKNSKYVHLWLHILLKANHEGKEFFWSGETRQLTPGQFITGRKTLSQETGLPETTIERILEVFEKEGQIGQQKNNKFRLIDIRNWHLYQKADNKRTTNGQQTDTNNNIKNENNENKYTVAHATEPLILTKEFMEIEYIPIDEKPSKSKYGSKVMAVLARHYLKTAGIDFEGTFNASKYSKGLSKIYQECGKDADEAMRRIQVAGDYFNSKGLSWTPEAVWRDWELIEGWKQKDKQVVISKMTEEERILSILKG